MTSIKIAAQMVETEGLPLCMLCSNALAVEVSSWQNHAAMKILTYPPIITPPINVLEEGRTKGSNRVHLSTSKCLSTLK